MIKSREHHQMSWPWWRMSMAVLSLLAFILSALMCWHFLFEGTMIGCGVDSPCEQVLHSKWSMVFGRLPVCSLAIGVYLAFLIAVFFIGHATEIAIRRQAWDIMVILAGSVAGSAIWFTILQKWIIGNFCPYCMATHMTGLLLALIVIWRSITEPAVSDSALIPHSRPAMVKKVFQSSDRIIRPFPVILKVMTGLLFAAILAVSQFIFSPAVTYRSGESQDNLLPVDYNDAPMVGSPQARYVVALLFDYQCSHCQKIHFMLNEAVNRYNGKLAFVLCPAPLNTRCNPYIPHDADAFKNSCELAQIGLAVWVAKRQAFPVFENWMFSFDSGKNWHPRSLENARAKAVELVGIKRFHSALESSRIGQYIQTCTHLYGKTIQNGAGGVPKLIFGSHWVIPDAQNADDLIHILQKSLALPKP